MTMQSRQTMTSTDDVADSHDVAYSDDNDIAAKLRAIMDGDTVDNDVDEHDELDEFQQIERELSVHNDDDDDPINEQYNGDHDENDNHNGDDDDVDDDIGNKYDAKYDDGNAVEPAEVGGN